MTISKYHEDWKAFANHKPLSFYLDIIKTVASSNSKWKHHETKTTNSGLHALIKEFGEYVESGTQPAGDRQRLFLETAYIFWLLSIKEPQHKDVLQRRISQSFAGTTYYEPGDSGFRQFEYELHAICRLVEEGIDFEDIEGDKKPDLLIKANNPHFVLEVKMPISNLVGAISKALGQIFQHHDSGAIVVGVDYLMSDDPSDEGKFRELCSTAYEKIKNKRIVCCLEYSQHSPLGAHGCIIASSSAPAHIRPIIEKTMTGD